MIEITEDVKIAEGWHDWQVLKTQGFEAVECYPKSKNPDKNDPVWVMRKRHLGVWRGTAGPAPIGLFGGALKPARRVG